jgi:three-Cys-motif partner protein
MTRIQRFGGAHTKKKLNAVAEYLQAYVTVMKKQRFQLSYVDGFAGSGASQSIGVEDDVLLLNDEIYETSTIVEGSPVRALNIAPPFDRYVFVDANPENVSSLKKLSSQFPLFNIHVREGDANLRLQEFADFLSNEPLERAVVFLDPFGLSVRWDTVAKLGATKKIDLWYLVPVHGMSRQIKDDGTFLPSAQKIDEIWGSSDWRAKAVRKSEPIEDLFGSLNQKSEKVAKAEQFSEMFRDRLNEAFAGGVAKQYLRLGKGRSHQYSLMFACANPSRAASGAALRIANHILG